MLFEIFENLSAEARREIRHALSTKALDGLYDSRYAYDFSREEVAHGEKALRFARANLQAMRAEQAIRLKANLEAVAEAAE